MLTRTYLTDNYAQVDTDFEQSNISFGNVTLTFCPSAGRLFFKRGLKYTTKVGAPGAGGGERKEKVDGWAETRERERKREREDEMFIS
jgi:hypothetical protein